MYLSPKNNRMHIPSTPLYCQLKAKGMLGVYLYSIASYHPFHVQTVTVTHYLDSF